jgi:hypothetical protein
MRSLRELESDVEITVDPMEDQSLDQGGSLEPDSSSNE